MSLAREFMSAFAMLRQLEAEGQPGLDLPALPTLDSALASLPTVPAHGALLVGGPAILADVSATAWRLDAVRPGDDQNR